MNTFQSVRSMLAALLFLRGAREAPREGLDEWQTILDIGL